MDPYMTTAKGDMVCPETGLTIRKGDVIAYYPREKSGYHKDSQSADDVRAMEFAKAFGMADANY